MDLQTSKSWNEIELRIWVGRFGYVTGFLWVYKQTY